MHEQPETPETLRLRAAQLLKEAIQSRDTAQHSDDGYAFRAEMAISYHLEEESKTLVLRAEQLEKETRHAAA